VILLLPRHTLIRLLAWLNRFWIKPTKPDWKMRLKGRFRNEYGAHAGFTEAELDAMIRPYFREVTWLTDDYLWFKYGRRLPSVLLRFICWRPVRAVLAPSVYCWARK